MTPAANHKLAHLHRDRASPTPVKKRAQVLHREGKKKWGRNKVQPTKLSRWYRSHVNDVALQDSSKIKMGLIYICISFKRRLFWRAIAVAFLLQARRHSFLCPLSTKRCLCHTQLSTKPRVLVPVAITHQPRVSNLAEICTLFPPPVFFFSLCHFHTTAAISSTNFEIKLTNSNKNNVELRRIKSKS